MANATITVDAGLKERLANLASESGQPVDAFIETLLRRFAGLDVRVELVVPVFPPRPQAPTLTVDDVDRLAAGESPEVISLLGVHVIAGDEHHAIALRLVRD